MRKKRRKKNKVEKQYLCNNNISITMEEKIDKLIEGQIKIQTKLESMEEKTNDQEKRIRSLETKFWTALGTFFVGIGTFIEGLFMK